MTAKVEEAVKPVACAIYTRRSPGEGLERQYNTIEAQRDCCRGYIESQRERGFYALEPTYDDAGFSGGNMERPAFKRLVEDAMAGKFECIVLYKIDRFARDLFQALCMLKTFSDHKVMCRSVTEDFDTTTSHGTFMLHNLLAAAEYQRRQTSERIRDKVAMAKAKGRHCGGTPLLGYDIVESRLVVNPAEAATVRRIFQRFAQCGSTTQIVRELAADNIRTKSWTTKKNRRREGHPFNKMHLYRLLQNRKYVGEVTHNEKVYPGEHQAIIDRELWDQVQSIFAARQRETDKGVTPTQAGLLRGLIQCAHCGSGMQATYSRKNGRTYRYYLCYHAAKRGHDTCPIKTIPAAPVEDVVAGRVRAMLSDPKAAARIIQALKNEDHDLEADETARAVADLGTAWPHLFPAEKARLIHLLVERVTAQVDGIRISYRDNGLTTLVRELAAGNKPA